jgi:hypothetical protein
LTGAGVGTQAADSLPIGWQLGQDTVMSSLVLGKPQGSVRPGSVILPDRQVRTLSVKWPVFGNEHLAKQETLRPAGADIKHRRFAVTYDSGELKRYSFATRLDEIEVDNARAAGMMPMDLREAGYALAQRAVEDDIERIKATMLTTSGSYDSANKVDCTTKKFNSASGNVYADARTVIEGISAKTGVGGSGIEAFVSRDTLNGIYRDPVFLAVRGVAGQGQGLRIPTEQEIAAYLGISRVWSEDVRVLNDDGTIGSLYSGVMIFYRPSGTPGVDTTFGDVIPGVTFTWGRGGARAQINMAASSMSTDVAWPWERVALPKVFSYDAMGLLYNCV